MLHRVHTQNAPTSEIMATTQTFKFSDWHYATVWTHCILKLLISRQNSSSSVGGATFLFVFNHDICHCPVLTTNTSSAFWLSEKKKKRKKNRGVKCITSLHLRNFSQESAEGSECLESLSYGRCEASCTSHLLLVSKSNKSKFFFFFFFFKHSWTF